MPCPVEPYRYVVNSPMLHPVVACSGDVLVVRPGHPTRPLAVVRHVKGRWRLVRLGPPNFGAIVGLECDGVVTALSAGSPALAEHPALRSA